MHIALCERPFRKCHVPHTTQSEMSSVRSMWAHCELLQDQYVDHRYDTETDSISTQAQSPVRPTCEKTSTIIEQIRDSRITGSRGGTRQRTIRCRVSTTRSQTGTFAPVKCDKIICNLYLGEQTQKSSLTHFTARGAASSSQTHKASRNCSLMGRLLRKSKKNKHNSR